MPLLHQANLTSKCSENYDAVGLGRVDTYRIHRMIASGMVY